MPLTAGARLGPYEITSPIGAGGMGEVYKAKDTRLDRTVAIKVLPSHLSDHDELRQRFEQEARAVSSLNHPNICTLHDIGRENGVDFIVMEYVEGETLAERLERGPLTWQEAVRYGIELSDALDKAHRAGVVHRDVKPGNIIVTQSGIKLLDFGLAKLHSGGGSEADLSAVTEAKPLTEKGAILGTFQYMSPEQLEGKESDARSDIFALGAVLYEMVTGERAFKGNSQASLIAAIMAGTPRAMSETGALSPASLDHVVTVALEKNPDRRWQSAGDVARNLEWIRPDGDGDQVAAGGAPWLRSAILAGLAFAAGIAVAAFMVSRFSTDVTPTPQHYQISLGPNEGNEPGVRAYAALSPDGSLLAYTAVYDGTSRLYLRRFDEPEAHEVPGTEGAYNPFFSEDGEWIGFNEYPLESKLKRVSIHGGTPQVLADANIPVGGTWLTDDTIVFSSGYGLFQVAASGGPTEALAGWEARPGDILMRPQRLPSRNAIVYTVINTDGVSAEVFSITSERRQTVIEKATNVTYIRTGHLLFVRDDALWAVPFDPARLEVTGPERPILSGLDHHGWASFFVSANGLLAYVPGNPGGWSEETLTWFGLDGERTPSSSETFDYQWPRFSPAGDKLALYSPLLGGASDVWILDFETNRLEQLTFDRGSRDPAWLPDGKSVVFASTRDGTNGLYQQSVDGSADAELLLESTRALRLEDVSPDGKVVVYRENRDLYVLSLEGRTVTPLVTSDTLNHTASFSPDGRYLTYLSNESGRDEVYEQPYPPTGGKRQVSRGGGSGPVWSANGRELYYLRDRTMMAVSVRLSPTLEILEERELFEAPVNRGRNFDVDPKTGRFLVVDKTIPDPAQYVNIVTNFFELLEQ